MEYTKFQTEEEKIAFLQRYDLIGKSGRKRKPFMYNGFYTSEPVEINILGYVQEFLVPDEETGEVEPWAEIVIGFDNKEIVINSEYLKEMN